MNFLQNLGLQAGVGLNGYNAMQKNTLANRQSEQQVQAGQNALDAQALAGLLMPQILNAPQAAGGQGMPGMGGMNPNQTPMFLPPQTQVPQGGNPSQDMAVMDLFGGGGQQAPQQDFRTAMMNAPAPDGAPAQLPPYANSIVPWQGQSGGQPQMQGAPTPVGVPGMERYQQLGQLMQQMGGQYNPAAQFGAAKNIMDVMNPQDRLYNQQVLQDMRNQMAQERMNSMMQMNSDRISGMYGLQSMRGDVSMRGQDMREPDRVDALKFDADNAAKDHRALVSLYGYNQTPEVAAQVEAARQRAEQAMATYRAEVTAGPTLAPSNTPAAGAPNTQVPSVATDADYEALAPGTKFLDPNGNERTKPK